jgi:hypothetical protein
MKQPLAKARKRAYCDHNSSEYPGGRFKLLAVDLVALLSFPNAFWLVSDPYDQ